MTTIYVLWLRQFKRYIRSRPRIVASLGQPLLFLLAFGFGFGPVFQKAGQGNYIQFLAPGVIAMTILFTSIFSGIELIWDRQFGFLKEMLVAPVPRIADHDRAHAGRRDGRHDAGHDRGADLPDRRFRVTSFSALAAWRFCFMALIAIMFTALGTAIASVLSRFSGIPADHEFSGDADFLSLRRAVSADQSAVVLNVAGDHRSAVLRGGWSAQLADRRFAFRRGDGSGRAQRTGRVASDRRRAALLPHPVVGRPVWRWTAACSRARFGKRVAIRAQAARFSSC